MHVGHVTSDVTFAWTTFLRVEASTFRPANAAFNGTQVMQLC